MVVCKRQLHRTIVSPYVIFILVLNNREKVNTIEESFILIVETLGTKTDPSCYQMCILSELGLTLNRRPL